MHLLGFEFPLLIMVSPGSTLAIKIMRLFRVTKPFQRASRELYAFVCEKLMKMVVGEDSTKGGNVKVFDGAANLQSP